MPQGTQSSDLLQIDAALEASLVALEDGLCIYAKDGLMDNRTVVKLFKEVKLCDMKKITVTDVDLGFAKFKTKGQAKMAPGEVVVLVEHLCQKAGKDFRQMVEVLTMHAEQGQDFKNVEVKAGQNRAVGPERFHYDKGTFTGKHAHGEGEGDRKYNNLAGLISRDHIQDDAVQRKKGVAGKSKTELEREAEMAERNSFSPVRKVSSISAEEKERLKRGSVGAQLLRASVTKPANSGRGSPKSGGRPKSATQESRLQTQQRIGMGSNRPGSPNSDKTKRPQTSGRQTQDIVNNAANNANNAKPKQLRGPERFFYDQSSYTGAHKAGGPDIRSGGNGGYSDLNKLIDRDHVQNDMLQRKKHGLGK